MAAVYYHSSAECVSMVWIDAGYVEIRRSVVVDGKAVVECSSVSGQISGRREARRNFRDPGGRA